ncbi:MAG TPA: fumarylacetoacetate hydrolase family protein [Terriglobia bacterium]|nr:fumarylacetoacetate hydrolase family protein [Terriglobia bacterium]
MKIAAFDRAGERRHGLVVVDQIHPLPADTDIFKVLTEQSVLDRCERPVRLDAVRLLPTVQPIAIRDFITFERHVVGSYAGIGRGGVPAEWYEIPTFYFTNPHSLIGANDPVPIPPGCKLFDFELEVAAIIGRDGYNLTVAEAVDHIAGFAIFNDWSARDLQAYEMRIGLGPAKGKDTASTLGPYLVTPDELEAYRRGDRYDLAMSVLVNHKLIGTDSLANAAWSFPEMIAYASRGTMVRAGDIIASGTCGSGCLLELWGRTGKQDPLPLAIGDIVTMTVEGLGTIENTVVAGVPAHPVPKSRDRDGFIHGPHKPF